MSNYIDGLNLLPLSHLQAGLKSSLKTDLTPMCVGSKRIDEGQGFLSVIAQLKLYWPTKYDNSSLPNSVVVKIPMPNKAEAELQRLQAESETGVSAVDDFLLHGHNAECKFYSHVANCLKNHYKVALGDVYHIQQFETTEERFSDQFGLIVMEDFVGRGRTLKFGTEQLNDLQMKSIINSIASIHAFCLANPSWNEATMLINIDDKYEKWSIIARKALLTLREEYPQYLTATDFEIDQISDGQAACHQLGTKNIPFKVIVHGDLWANNLIFAKDKNDQVGDDLLAIIDWQACHPGGICEDFARLINSSVDTHVRRSNTRRWLKHYYKLLRKRLPKGMKVPFSFEELLRMYQKSLGIGAFMMALLVGLFLNNPYDRLTEKEKINLVVRLQMSIEDAIAAKRERQFTGPFTSDVE